MTKLHFKLALAVGLLTSGFAQAAVPNLAITFDTNVATVSMSSSQEAKIQTAEQKIRDVIGSDAFRTKVLNFTYNGVKRFYDNGGLSNLEIYNKILAGAEKLRPSKNNAMDLGIKIYYQNSSVVGYTTTGSTYINMNTKFLNTYTSSQVSRNMMHEWLHKVGFKHAVSYSKSRDSSVPYGIGRIMEELARKY